MSHKVNFAEGTKELSIEEETRVKSFTSADRAATLSTIANSKATSDDGGASPQHTMSKRTGLFDFANAQSIKEKIRKSRKTKTKYNVANFYYESGFFQWLAKHKVFEHVTLAVIAANAAWIGIDTDHNEGKDGLNDATWVFVLADCLFFGYFSFELFVRFMAFKIKKNCLKDGWFCFDSCLVFLYLLDPFILSLVSSQTGGGEMDVPTAILRLFRLARLSRLVRMLRSLPELMILVKGMVMALASVGYALGLLILMCYIFGIALTQLSVGYEFRELYFSSVPHAMYSLGIFGTFLDDLAAFGDPIKAESTVCLMIVTVFIILSSMTLMNMLIGVLCEVIDAVALREREAKMVDTVYEQFTDIYDMLDCNESGGITLEEFNDMLIKPNISGKAIKALESVNVDVNNMIDNAEEYFSYMGIPIELSFEEFMDMVLELRGGQECMVKDVVLLGKRFSKKFHDIKKRLRIYVDKLNMIETVW